MAEQELFASLEQHQVYLGTIIEGMPPKVTSITVVTSRFTPSGAYNGTLHAALNVDYFLRLFRMFGASDAMLVRRDGEVLVSNAKAPDYYLDPSAPLMRKIAEQPTGHFVATEQTLYSYLPLPGFPLYVSLGMNRTMILRHWRQDVLIYGITALAASLALAGVSWFAVRRANDVEAALIRLNIETEIRVEVEQRLHAAHRTEAIGQLTAGIAHDFNNLLAIIIGNLELIARTRNHEQIKQFVERAHRASERGASLISSMLAFAGKQMLNLQTMNLNEAILDIHPMLEQSAGETTAVVLKLDPALRQCKMDVVQFDTTLLNLAVNAKDAMAGDGTLTITTRNTHLDQADDTPAIGPCVAVSVEDTGSGMTDAVRERVFEPFFTTKQMGTGTGLGLSQVHGFVRQIGGHVTVDSKPGGGTTVTMYFPSA